MYINIRTPNSAPDWCRTIADVIDVSTSIVCIGSKEGLTEISEPSNSEIYVPYIDCGGNILVETRFPLRLLRLNIETKNRNVPLILYTDGAAFLCTESGNTVERFFANSK